jgi:hypothetical protein
MVSKRRDESHGAQRMKDIVLFGHLKALGMPERKAWRLTAQIRDELHPVAAIAAAKLHGSGQARPVRHSLAGSTGTALSEAQIGSKAGGIVGGAIAAGGGVAAGAAAGSIVPIVGTAIGAVLGFAIGKFFGPAKLGQASIVWNDMVAHQYLQQQRGAAFDERYFAEAMKGAMDEGNNVWPKCGPDRHKDPDCFYGPLAQVIREGYLTGRVPVTASTLQVWQSVVLPWLQSGADGLVNWQNLSHEPGQPVGNTLQMLLIEGAVDRYVNGLPITRADMPEYQGQGYTDHQPPISSVLAQVPATQTVSSAVATQPSAIVPSQLVSAGSSLAQSVNGSPAGGQTDTTAAMLQQLLAQNGVSMQSPAATGLVNQVASQGVTQTAYGPAPGSGSGLPKWLVPAGIAAVVAAKVLL